MDENSVLHFSVAVNGSSPAVLLKRVAEEIDQLGSDMEVMDMTFRLVPNYPENEFQMTVYYGPSDESTE